MFYIRYGNILELSLDHLPFILKSRSVERSVSSLVATILSEKSQNVYASTRLECTGEYLAYINAPACTSKGDTSCREASSKLYEFLSAEGRGGRCEVTKKKAKNIKLMRVSPKSKTRASRANLGPVRVAVSVKD